MTLRSPSLRYLHFLLSRTVIGRGNNTSVISKQDFNFLLSMLDGFQMHLGCEAAVSIAHQGIDPWTWSLFVSLYITRLIQGISILEGTNRIRVICGVAPISIETLRSMCMLQSVRTTRGVEYRVRWPADTAAPAIPDSLPAAIVASHQRSPPSPRASWSLTDQGTCSASTFKWLQRSVTMIAKHLGIRLSPKPSSRVKSLHHGGCTLLTLGLRILVPLY